jgi:ABC-type Fe3+ transport system substrate-binding protein
LDGSRAVQYENKKAAEKISRFACGKTGIRTLEPLWTVTRFPDVPLQPLEHLSNGTAKIHIPSKIQTRNSKKLQKLNSLCGLFGVN